jgi:malonyl-CoA decarboxylase
MEPMTTAPEWITRNVSRLRGVRPATDAAPSTATTKPEAERSTHERLQATLRRGSEALTPRALRRLLADLQEVVAPRVSEIEGGNRAQAVATGTPRLSLASDATCGC